jgi:hypothetical protein
VLVEKLGYEGWKALKDYGKRWMVESAISSFKRAFGEHVTSVKWRYTVNELLLKASVYNMSLSARAQRQQVEERGQRSPDPTSVIQQGCVKQKLSKYPLASNTKNELGGCLCRFRTPGLCCV